MRSRQGRIQCEVVLQNEGVTVSQPRPSGPGAAPRVAVPAGTTAGTAVREAGLPGKGADAIVVVRDADGRLRDPSWTPEADVEGEAGAPHTQERRPRVPPHPAHLL